MKIDRYKNISNLGSEYKKLKTFSHIPKPNNNDYLIGYIVRYFLQKSNYINSPIFEINVNSITKYVNNPFYKTTSLDWRINGTSDEIKKSNAASIKLASADIPKIGLYLPNLLQFHKK